MRIIKTLSENIEEEIEDVRKYARLAIEVRNEGNAALAQLYYQLATQESEHVMKLHAQVTALISDYRSKNGEPPEGMLEIYNYLHVKHTDAFADAKRYLDIYQGKV